MESHHNLYTHLVRECWVRLLAKLFIFFINFFIASGYETLFELETDEASLSSIKDKLKKVRKGWKR